jgi:hypothetical protein
MSEPKMGKAVTTALLLGCLWLSGCATAYQSGKFAYTGGYVDQPVTEQLRKVVFYANGFTDIATALKYARFRCAELAQEGGKPYFIMYGSLELAARGVPSRQPSVGNIGSKPAAFAFLALGDEPVPGATKTSDVIAELQAMRESYSQAKSGTRSTKN